MLVFVGAGIHTVELADPHRCYQAGRRHHCMGQTGTGQRESVRPCTNGLAFLEPSYTVESRIMATNTQRIAALEQIVAAMTATAPATRPSKAFDVIQITAAQSDAVQKLLQSWVTLEGTEGGEFDPMDYLAANRGWNPLTVEEKMLIHIGDKAYEIRRAK